MVIKQTNQGHIKARAVVLPSSNRKVTLELYLVATTKLLPAMHPSSSRVVGCCYSICGMVNGNIKKFSLIKHRKPISLLYSINYWIEPSCIMLCIISVSLTQWFFPCQNLLNYYFENHHASPFFRRKSNYCGSFLALLFTLI